MSAEAVAVVTSLTVRGETIAVCESLTGGALGAALTTVPGASAVFRGGLVTYATELKTTLAGVPAALIAQHGVVSRQVAAAMAKGARERCGATWGVSTTGVAGPGAVDGQPPGAVWIAVDGPAGAASTQHHRFAGDRAAVRAQAVDAAVALLADQIRE